MNAIAKRMVADAQFLASFKAQELANTVWAFASLGLRSDRLMARIGDRLLAPGVVSGFTTQAIAMTCWAFATLGYRHEAMGGPIVRRILQPGFLPKASLQEVGAL